MILSVARRNDDVTTERLPPHNAEAEMALLGAILSNNRAFEKVAEFLRPEHFADDAHRRVFEAIARIIDRGQIANPITLKTYLDQDGALNAIGGLQYVARLAAAVPSIINTENYGRLVHDLYLRRELIALGEDLVNRAYAPDSDSRAIDQIEMAEQLLYDLASTGQFEGGFQDFSRALAAAITIAEAAYKRDSHVTGVSTGLVDLDKKLGGLHPSDLIVLAGRPSMGKTALATKIAFKAACAYRETPDGAGGIKVVDGAKVAFFSLEMSAEQLATRLLAEETQVPSDKIRRGEVRKEDFPRFIEASQQLARIPLYIDDTPALTISAVRTRARRLKRQHGLGLIVIDYLQLLRPSHGSKPENRVQEVSDITRGLKALAKELHVPVVALSQLSRAVEQREDKRPQLADLRESGTIEQDADVVMFVYREQYYHERAEPTRRPDENDDRFNDRIEKWAERGEKIRNIAEVIIAKQRHGPIGAVKLLFDGTFTKFDNLATPMQGDDAPF